MINDKNLTSNGIITLLLIVYVLPLGYKNNVIYLNIT